MKQLNDFEKIEQSIIKKYRKTIWKPFVRSINEYQMIDKNDKIAVCISGGKDSMLLAKCMQEILRHGKFKFKLVFLVMDPGYNSQNRQKIIENAQRLNIPITIFESDIFEVVNTVEDSPCYLCARMRRGFLYKKAQELGCNKIALGHHFDDVIETVLLSMFYGAEIKTMVPKLHSTNFLGMQLIRPLYFVKEKDIILWKAYNNLDFIRCACKFTENETSHEEKSKRLEMKRLIETLRINNPNVDINILKSTHNVNTDTLIGYKNDEGEHDFLSVFNKKKNKIKKQIKQQKVDKK